MSKIKVYQSELGKYVEMESIGKYKYIGNEESISLIPNKVYDCVAIDLEDDLFDGGVIGIVDESGEDYAYPYTSFERIEDTE